MEVALDKNDMNGKEPPQGLANVKEPHAGETDWEALAREAMRGRRKGKRLPLSYPIEVSGIDHTGLAFTERTGTVDISQAGCRIMMKKKLERGDVVVIRVVARPDHQKPNDKATLFQVIWVSRHEEDWMVGLQRLQTDDIWEVSFPEGK